MTTPKKNIMTTFEKIGQSLLLSVFSCYFYCFFEWLFFATKPSPLSVVGFGEQLSILAMSPLPLILVVFPGSVAVILLSRISWFKPVEKVATTGLSSLVTASALFLLLENFTYTLFGINAGNYTGWPRYLYLVGFVSLVVWVFRRVRRLVEQRRFYRIKTSLYVVCTMLLAVSFLVFFSRVGGDAVKKINLQTNAQSLPNILIFSTDGLRTDNVSAYGYSRKTTPFIDSLLGESLVFENHFANHARTTGSVLSMLSGKLPTTLRVHFRPDILTGEDTYQHLPAILRKFGYYNGDISVRHYVDAFDVNLREGFDEANGRKIPRNSIFTLPAKYQQAFGITALFLNATLQRIFERLSHISGIQDFHNPYNEVTVLNHNSIGTDEQRLEDLKTFIKESPRPFFASVHMLNTHGPLFYFRTRHFSSEKQEQEFWDWDYYDDAILNFDTYVRDIVALLKAEAIWEDTILIISSDHGTKGAIFEPIPLIIRFPGTKHIGRVTTNSQRIDLAPTILEFLGAGVPEWMEGVSLLGPDRELDRDIFAGNRAKSETINGWREVPNPQPPFYTLGTLAIIHCHQWFQLTLSTNHLHRSTIKSHTAPCDDAPPMTMEQARRLLVQHLEERGYDITSIRNASR